MSEPLGELPGVRGAGLQEVLDAALGVVGERGRLCERLQPRRERRPIREPDRPRPVRAS